MKSRTVRKRSGSWIRRGLSSLLTAALAVTAFGLCGSAADAQESIYTQSFESVKAGDPLPDGIRLGSGTVNTGDGYLEILKGSSLLLPESVSEKDFTYEVEFTIARADEPTRWAGFMFRYQTASRYLQMCCRQNASAANGMDCAFNNNGGWQYPSGGKGSYLTDIDPNKIYTAKVVVKDDRVALYIDNTLCVLTTALLDEAGAFGVQANGSTVRVYSVSVSQPEEIPDVLPDGSESMKDLYTAETGIVSAPTVVQKIDSKAKLDALDTDGKRTQVAWFALADKDLNVKVDNTSYTMAEILDACGGKVLPLFETADTETAEAFASYMAENGECDGILASGQIEALAAAWEVNSALRYAYLAGEITEENTVAKVARDTHTGGATIAILQPNDALDRTAAEYLQLRGISVWLNAGEGTDGHNVRAAVDCGANGVTVKDFAEAYALYEMVKESDTVCIRKTFIVGHRGLPNKAPENSKEGYLEAVEAGADAIECDVNITKDGVLVSNHNGSVNGYTTDESAAGAISSFTWEELSQFTLKPVGEYRESQFCKMEWYFQILKDNPSVVGYVELKDGSETVVQKTVELIEEMGVEDQVFVISFSDSALKLVRKYAPYLGTGRLASGTYDSGKSMESNLVALMKAVGASAATPDYGYGDFSADMIEAGRHRGILFQNWTVNSMSDIASLHLKGVDCVTTDFSSFSQNKELLDYQDVTAAGLFGEEEPQPTDPDDPQGGSSSDVTDSPDTGVDTQALFAAMGIGMAAVLVLFRFSRKKRA